MIVFVVLQTSDDAPGKPHPGMLKNAMPEMDAAPDETVFVGDTTFDMEMARNAGVEGVGRMLGLSPARGPGGARRALGAGPLRAI